MSLRDLLLTKRSKLSIEGALSTGSTLLNLACTDNPDSGYFKGGYVYMVGDSMSGKTWFSLTCLAEAARNPAFDKYRLIYDDVEGGALMDIEKYFGKRLARRIEPPALRKGKFPRYSTSVESFYFNLQDVIDDGRPFVYILDSQDALGSKAAKEKFLEQKKAFETNRESTGSYGDGKAKYHSEHIREVISSVRRRKSILFIIGQTRDNLGMGFDKKTRSGGKALRFYANFEIWTSVKDKIKKRVNGIPRTVGVNILAEVRKNRVTGKIGKDRAITIPIYYGYGMDDIGSCVDFLISEDYWPQVRRKKTESEDGDTTEGKRNKKVVYDAKELMVEGTREQIIAHVEQEDLESKVRELAAKLWSQIEEACAPKRKMRYE